MKPGQAGADDAGDDPRRLGDGVGREQALGRDDVRHRARRGPGVKKVPIDAWTKASTTSSGTRSAEAMSDEAEDDDGPQAGRRRS